MASAAIRSISPKFQEKGPVLNSKNKGFLMMDLGDEEKKTNVNNEGHIKPPRHFIESAPSLFQPDFKFCSELQR